MFFTQNTFWVTRQAGKRGRDGALSWQEYIGTIQRDSRNMIKGLTPYQILEKLTSQTKERCEVCWKTGTMMNGQQQYQKILDNFRREPMFIRVRQGHTGKNLDISTFSHAKIETRIRTISVSYRILKIRRFCKIWRTCDRRFWNKQKQKSSVFLTCVAVGSKPRPEVQALTST